MKNEIHPEYFPEAQITCGGCGTVMTIGSVRKSIEVSICSSCHPFYTGKEKLVDSAGRVDRFKQKYAKFTAEKK